MGKSSGVLTDVVRDAGETKATQRGLEVKSANYGTKVLDEEQGIAEMLVAVTGIEDHVNDIIEPGAIEPGLKSRWPKGIWHHTWESPICKTLEARELMPGDPDLPKTLRDGSPWPAEAGAFKVMGQFNLETQRGREAFSDVKFFGDMQEWSIGYKVERASRGKDGIRRIKSMTIPEYSPVLFGAMPLATTLSTKDDGSMSDGQKDAFVNLPGSMEERLDAIEDAVEAILPSQGVDPTKSAIRIVGTYDDRVIYAVADGEKADEVYFEAIYSLNERGALLSPPHPVDVRERQGEKSDDPLVAVLELAGEMAVSVKAGRVLSGANAAKVRAAVSALGEVLSAAQIEEVVDAIGADSSLEKAISALSEVKAGLTEAKYSPDQERDDHGRFGEGGGGSGSDGSKTVLKPEHHEKLSFAKRAIDEVLKGAASLSALGGFPNAAKADPMAKKPHAYDEGDDGKCKACGTDKDNPMHNTKADAGTSGERGPDATTHEYAAGQGGYCSKCQMVMTHPIHDLPYGREYGGPADGVGGNIHGSNKGEPVDVTEAELLQWERERLRL